MTGTPDNEPKPTVLIVDDTPRNINVLANVLSREGHLISAATSGKQAFTIIEKIVPDLILLDIMMPEMDGFEVCRRLKASPKTSNIPIIFLTAKTESEDIVTGFEMGAVDYVTKPFTASVLVARVRTHLDLKMIQERQAKTITSLEEALAKVKLLSGLVPICAHCKKIRDDKGYWNQIEVYISEHSEADFSHGICPDCVHELYPDYQSALKKHEKDIVR